LVLVLSSCHQTGQRASDTSGGKPVAAEPVKHDLPSGAIGPQPAATPPGGGVRPSPATETPAAAIRPDKEIRIDLDKAAVVALPKVAKDLHPAAFTTSDGRKGWVVRVPGSRPIATPAYADGMIFVGGGYGSHEFYAFGADTGKLVWQVKCADDGPTAAVVEDGCVAFNTESCTLIVCDARTGKILWQEWLGDPLMSQPTIYRGKVYIAYPGGRPRGPVVGPGGPKASPNAAGAVQAAGKTARLQTVGPAKGKGYRLLCAEVRTGRHLWEQDITADVITASAVEGGRLYFTCMEGTSFCLDAGNGTVVWKKRNAGISAPLLADGKVIHTRKVFDGTDFREGIVRFEPKGGSDTDAAAIVAGKATYLKPGKGGNVALSSANQATLDASVGFGGGGPVANSKAAKHLNLQGVAGGWTYQGARAAFCRGRILNAQSAYVNCVRAKDGSVAWGGQAVGKGVSPEVQMFAPPALGRKNLYVCSARGHLLSMKQDTGETDFAYNFRNGIAFQPCLARGNVYAGTINGLIICLKTGDTDADGWTAWGGNAQHNKTD